MHNSRWRLFLLGIIILLPGAGFSKEALTFKQALDKYSDNRGAIYLCATTARIVGKKVDSCWRAVLRIQMAGKDTEPPQKIDDAAAWTIIEDIAGKSGPTRFTPLGRERSLNSIARMVASILGDDHPDLDMIECLSELEFQAIEDSLSCNYAYAKVRLIMSKVADAPSGNYKLDRAEFPYVLQQSLERAYAGSKTPQP